MYMYYIVVCCELSHKATAVYLQLPVLSDPRLALCINTMRTSLLLMAVTITVTMATAFDLNPALIKTVANIVNSAVNEEGQVTVAGRVIKYKAKGRVHSFKDPWVYDGTAWDITSGISEKAKHYMSKQGAIEHAMLKLLERLKREGIMKDEL